jgi:hypothetical protein
MDGDLRSRIPGLRKWTEAKLRSVYTRLAAAWQKRRSAPALKHGDNGTVRTFAR